MNITDLNTVLEGIKNLGKPVVNAQDIRAVVSNLGLTPSYEWHAKKSLAAGTKRGEYHVEGFSAEPKVLHTAQIEKQPNIEVQTPMIKSAGELDVNAVAVDPTFVGWGHFADIKKIVNSKQFFPTFISGPSGNGKTVMVDQACAQAKSGIIRVQMSEETDTDDLIGGWTLIDGETVFRKGPILLAMEAGVPVLLDEVDRGTNKILALQGIMEGKPYFIKKTGEYVYPKPGFNIIATANTKGQGCDTGKFSGASILDDAFLERFVITVEQGWPTRASEKKILNNHFGKYGAKVEEATLNRLLDWSETIRKTYNDGGIDEVISTRRLCHIAQTMSIFNDIKKAVELCTSRFDTETKEAFVQIWDALTPADEAAQELPEDNDLGLIIDDIIKP